jgi:MFS family permease
MTVPSWAIGFVVSLVVAWTADRFNSRGYHAAGVSALSAIGFMTSAILPAHVYKARYACLLIASCGAFPTISLLMSWVSCNAPSNKVNGLVVALNCTGTGLASIASVWIWKASEAPRGYPTGNRVCAVCSWVCCAMSLGLRWYYSRLNKKIRESGDGQREWVL